jgi:predicted AlkP superfamily pyrophosphatase or phosphodiesterase
MKISSLTLALVTIFCLEVSAQVHQAKHVILIGSDGLGSYAFERADIPNLRRLMQEGAYTLKARSVLPSSSAVNWMSMISGTPPEIHGFTDWGSKTPEIPSSVLGSNGLYPTIFSLLERQKPAVKKGVAYVWGGIGYLFEKEYVDLDFNGERPEVLNQSISFLTEEKPYFTFIHFSQPDAAGHNVGHDTPAYYEAVHEVDKAIGQLIEALDKAEMLSETLILISSDHGGKDKGHGGKTLVEMEIPWILWGAGLKKQGVLAETIITYDTAATLAYVMGLELPQSWRGQAQKQLFD